MTSYTVARQGSLTGKRIAVLMESDFVEEEVAYYQMRFAEEGAEVELFSRLWGNSDLTFTGHEHRGEIRVNRDIASLTYDELCRYVALIVPAGMVADRLRYSENLHQRPPAVELMQRAFRLPSLIKAFSCHGLLLMSTAPELIRNRPVTAHNNLVGDVRNMGAIFTGEDVVIDGDLVTGRSVEQSHLLAKAVISEAAKRS